MTQAVAAIVIYAGLAGAAGVALAAAGAHGEGYAALTPAAQFLLMHGAAALAVAAIASRAAHPGGFLIAALILLIGVSLFSGASPRARFGAIACFPWRRPSAARP